MEKLGQLAVELHRKQKGKIKIALKGKLNNIRQLSLAYTPGVAQVCREIAASPDAAFDLTMKWNSVAILTDGSRVLGLGNIGPAASLPVMEGKALLFKRFGGVDAFPLCLDVKSEDEFVQAAKAIAPVFGGINLEDIENPKCYGIESRLEEKLGIPVMHDDQHGTAVVALAGLINSLKVAGKKLEAAKVVINGAGAAGSAIAKLLGIAGVNEIIVCDSKGVISKSRADLDTHKSQLAAITNKQDVQGTLEAACKGADAIIGASVPGSINQHMVKSMSEKPIVFALANPIPEISLEDARLAGAFVYATGRSDLPNQINNVLGFPGIFRGALDVRASRITSGMKLAASYAIANSVPEGSLSREFIVPTPFDSMAPFNVALAVATLAQTEGAAHLKLSEGELREKIKENIKG
ncbi:NADP-dependent malic enzyme [Candidatus Parvarchaeota archaeon]|nr:NADP-dependent malic enzyme [Candidatus Parvarchaeota archaeon]